MCRFNFRGASWLALAVSCSLVASWLAMGCESSAIAARRRANEAAYASLTREVKALVDRGKVANGMTTNAVFIAWGQPQDIGTIPTPKGPFLVWNYYKEAAIQVSSAQLAEANARNRAASSSQPVEISSSYHAPTVMRHYLDRTAVFHKGRLVSWHIEPKPE